MKTLKKVTAVFLAVAMFLSMGISANYVQAEDRPEDNTPLVLNQETGLISQTGGEIYWFSFTPETDGYYYFKSTAPEYSIDPWARLFLNTQNGYMDIAYDDDGSFMGNFNLGYSLKAGVTYYLQVGQRQAGMYGVVVVESPIRSLSFEPLSVVERTRGYVANQGSEDEYYHYNNWVSEARYHVTMKDGAVVSGTGMWVHYHDQQYRIDFSDTQGQEHWYLGNSYTATASVAGCTASVPISIIEPPVDSIVIQPISFVQNSGGWLQNQGNEYEYYQYYWWQNINCTIVMKDGQVINGTNGSVEYNGQSYWLGDYCHDGQSYENPWTVGNTYTGTVNFMGYEATASISIIDTPIQSIEVAPISIIENSYGYIVNEGSEEQYWRYEWWNRINYTITMKDGQVLKGINGSSFEYNGQWYWFGQYPKDTQSPENPWQVNQTYDVSFEILGYKKELQVSIIDTPIEKVEIAPISIKAGTCGGTQQPGTPYEYYQYHWWNRISYTITMKNGQIITGTDESSFYYDGRQYWMSEFTSDGQSPENPWEEGNTYTGTINILGYKTEVPITIEESPVQSISFEPIVMAENTYGSWNYGPNPGDQWFRYDWQQFMQWTVTMKDGSVRKGSGPAVWIDGEYCSTSYDDHQWEEHWYPGNTYTVKVGALGKTAEMKVSICEMAMEDGFEYMVQDQKAIVIGCDSHEASLTIPSTLGGYPVVAVTDLTVAMDTLQELTIPDSVTMLSRGLFDWNYDLVKLNLGTGIANLSNEMFIGAKELQEINIAEGNADYTSVDGVVYDKDVTELVVFPRGKKGTYTVPNTVTEISCLIDNIRNYDVELNLGDSNTNYILEDGVIYNKDKTVIYACVATETGKYVMPNSVETINQEAFKNCTFSEVVVSENVSEIVYNSFAYSMELEKVVLPDSIEAIGLSAFDGCENLVEADLPANLQTLEDSAFRKTAVKKVTIPGTLKQVGYSAYKEAGVEELTLQEGVEVIWNHAFYQTQIKDLALPNSLMHMGKGVFADTLLESVSIGSGLERISEEAFQNTNLTSVTLPENIAEIGEYAFANAPLEEILIMRDDVYIFEGAFCNCPLQEIDLREGIVAIGDYAFYGNHAESIVIPSSVTDVTYQSFAESKQLIDIDVPDKLNSIDGTAFDGTAWWEAQADGVVYLENYLYGYKGEMPAGTEITVREGTTLIANYAFDSEYNLKALHLPSSIRNIGNVALNACFGLETITVAGDNTMYSTNEDGTALYNQNGFPVWRKAQAILDMDVDRYMPYGMSVEEWLADYLFVPVCVRYVDGSEDWERCAITSDMVSGFDSTRAGWQTITIDFGRLTCEFEICIEGGYPTAPMVGIKVVKLPNRTSYDLNQSFRPTGMIVNGVNADGSEFEVEGYEVYGFDSSEPGMKTVFVNYMGYETSFDVEVVAERITHVSDVTETGMSIEISASTEAVEEGAQLLVDEKTVADVVEEVEVPEIFEQNQSQIFDIRFEKEQDGENVEVQPTEEVIVSIPVPDGMDGRNCKVYHLTNGEAVDMKATFSGGFLVFPTNHFSYYGIVEVNGSSISGQIDDTDVMAGDVTVTLINGEVEQEAVIAVDGSYNFTALENGTYIVRIEKTGHATREYQVIIDGDSVEQNGQIRLMGDVDGNGEVDIHDWKAIRDHINESIFVEGYDYSCADIDGNGKVNIRDWNALKAHLNESKPLW